MIVITGATGNTGKVAADNLLDAGEKIRVIGRSAEKLQPFAQRGAEAFPADILDSKAITLAFRGADAVYLMIPPDPSAEDPRAEQERVSDSLTAALAGSGVRHAVLLSSVGADKSERTGPIMGLHNFEEKIRQVPGVNALFLRPNYFMENNLMQIGIIRAMGVMGGTYRGDLALPQICTRDIGRAAAEALRKRDFSGCQTRELLGPRDVTFNEIAKIIGPAIGKAGLAYKEVPEMVAQMGMRQMGLSEKFAKLLMEMAEAFNQSWVKPLEARSAQNTMATTFEQFTAQVFVPAFNAKS